MGRRWPKAGGGGRLDRVALVPDGTASLDMTARKKMLIVRSTHAHNLAHKLAREHGCTVVTVVERVLDAYVKTATTAKSAHEPAADFYARMSREYALDHGEEIDLDAIIRASRVPHKPVEF
jgi:hypothetical protein